jgi:hypothetical protein
MGTETLIAIADRGYFKGEKILACHAASICAMAPKTMKILKQLPEPVEACTKLATSPQ